MTEWVKFLYGKNGKLLRNKQISLMVFHKIILEEKKLNDQEYFEALTEKLIEEMQEIIEASSMQNLLEEMADVSEVLIAIKNFRQISEEQVKNIRAIINEYNVNIKNPSEKSFLGPIAPFLRSLKKEIESSQSKFITDKNLINLVAKVNIAIENLCKYHAIPISEIERIRQDKENKHGNFSDRRKFLSVEYDNSHPKYHPFTEKYGKAPGKYIEVISNKNEERELIL